MAKFKRPFIQVRGAYGRKYQTETALMNDWNSGVDFQDCLSGQYLSIRDVPYMIEQLETEWIDFIFNGENAFSREIKDFVK
jgi:hypothetical protein